MSRLRAFSTGLMFGAVGVAAFVLLRALVLEDPPRFDGLSLLAVVTVVLAIVLRAVSRP